MFSVNQSRLFSALQVCFPFLFFFSLCSCVNMMHLWFFTLFSSLLSSVRKWILWRHDLSSHFRPMCYIHGKIQTDMVVQCRNLLSCFSGGQAVSYTVHTKAFQSCPSLCDPIDHSPPGSSVHGILQSRTLECVVILFSRGSSWPRDWTTSLMFPALAGRFFTTSATREVGVGGSS